MLRQLRRHTARGLLVARQNQYNLNKIVLAHRFHKSALVANERPWYVAEAQNLAPKPEEVADLPATPSDAPKFMKSMLETLSHDLGMKDLMLVDARDSLSLPGWMVIGTGTSQKHLGAAAQELATELKKSHGIVATKTGVLTPNFLRVHARRQRRRAQQQRTVSATEHLARIDPWVVLDTHEGVLVHLMTADRRATLDLETLFSDVPEELDNDVDEEYLDPRRPDPKTLGKRLFHTSCRREEQGADLLAELEEGRPVTREIVEQFTSGLPAILSREDWRVNLTFFSVAASSGPEQCLDDLLEAAVAQQSAGYVLDKQDLERIVCGVCYNGQAEFSQLPLTEETIEKWHALCNHKAKVIAELHSFACETADKSFLTDPRIAVLLYRGFLAPSVNADTSSDKRLFWDRRLKSLVEIVQSTDEILSTPVLRMVLNSLANGGTWGTFWRILANVQLRSAFSTAFLEEIVALVVRCKDTAQISHALQVFVPSTILRYKLKVTPGLTARLGEALDVVDPQKSSYKALRGFIAHSR